VRAEESNGFGTDEYLGYCEELGTEPYICLNMAPGRTSSTLTPARRLPGNPDLNLPQGADWHRTHPRPEGKRLSAGIENDPGDEIVADPLG